MSDDSISRQAAIDTLADMYCKSDEDGYIWIIRSDAWARIDALPSVQPDVIRCKDCKYYRPMIDQDDLCDYRQMQVFSDDYCSRAEGREDG